MAKHYFVVHLMFAYRFSTCVLRNSSWRPAVLEHSNWHTHRIRHSHRQHQFNMHQLPRRWEKRLWFEVDILIYLYLYRSPMPSHQANCHNCNWLLQLNQIRTHTHQSPLLARIQIAHTRLVHTRPALTPTLSCLLPLFSKVKSFHTPPRMASFWIHRNLASLCLKPLLRQPMLNNTLTQQRPRCCQVSRKLAQM